MRLVLLLLALVSGRTDDNTNASPGFLRVFDLGPVWSGHPVGFSWLVHGDQVVVAFYDADRRLTVASRHLSNRDLEPDANANIPPAEGWATVKLDSKLGWDSHNSLVLARDKNGDFHLSGNMHGVPLVYFRTETPGDIHTFRALHRMTGDREARCTYPRFFDGPDGAFLFSYRDGSSGNGDNIINVYDLKTKTWKRLLDRPLLDGQGQRNAYPFGPTRGPDGFFHLGWVWRETPDCATNHDISYARSRDLVHWETASGEPLALPMVLDPRTIVDPVPVGGGLLNVNTSLFIDSQQCPILVYHKHDEHGHTQAYTARFEQGAWRVRPATSWPDRWHASGGGTIVLEITLRGLSRIGPDRLALSYSHWKAGSGRVVLDENTMTPVADDNTPTAPARPDPLARVEGKTPGLKVHRLQAKGPHGTKLVLRWETLGANRDRPRPGPPPPPSPLRLYVLATGE